MGKVVAQPVTARQLSICDILSSGKVERFVTDKASRRAGSFKRSWQSEYVFFSPLTNGPISPDNVLHMLHRVLDRAGLPRIRFHDPRHRLAGGRPPFSLCDISPVRGGISFATMALQNGVDVKNLSSILGYFSAGFTLNTFAPRKHCRPARLERVAVLCVCSLTRLRFIRHRRRSARSPTSPPICSRTL